jgi:hypothetical protein
MVRSIVFRRLALVFFVLLLATLSTSPVHAQETVAVDLTITSVTVDRAGNIIITGILICAEPGEAIVRADASEQVGRTFLSGSGEINDVVTCGPAGTTVTVSVTPQVGTFRPGIVSVVLLVSVCSPDRAICSAVGGDSAELTLRVKRTR